MPLPHAQRHDHIRPHHAHGSNAHATLRSAVGGLTSPRPTRAMQLFGQRFRCHPLYPAYLLTFICFCPRLSGAQVRKDEPAALPGAERPTRTIHQKVSTYFKLINVSSFDLHFLRSSGALVTPMKPKKAEEGSQGCMSSAVGRSPST